jgi:hypothetical protein
VIERAHYFSPIRKKPSASLRVYGAFYLTLSVECARTSQHLFSDTIRPSYATIALRMSPRAQRIPGMNLAQLKKFCREFPAASERLLPSS